MDININFFYYNFYVLLIYYLIKIILKIIIDRRNMIKYNHKNKKYKVIIKLNNRKNIELLLKYFFYKLIKAI